MPADSQGAFWFTVFVVVLCPLAVCAQVSWVQGTWLSGLHGLHTQQCQELVRGMQVRAHPFTFLSFLFHGMCRPHRTSACAPRNPSCGNDATTGAGTVCRESAISHGAPGGGVCDGEERGGAATCAVSACTRKCAQVLWSLGLGPRPELPPFAGRITTPGRSFDGTRHGHGVAEGWRHGVSGTHG